MRYSIKRPESRSKGKTDPSCNRKACGLVILPDLQNLGNCHYRGDQSNRENNLIEDMDSFLFIVVLFRFMVEKHSRNSLVKVKESVKSDRIEGSFEEVITLKQIGKVTHYYDKIGVAIVKFNKKVKAGEKIHFGNENGFDQEVVSMQLDHKPVSEVKADQEVGIKVDQKVGQGTTVSSI